MLKIKDNVDLKELEKFGYKTFTSLDENYLIAVKDIYDYSKIIPTWYRIGVNEKERIFNKTKARIGKCLLQVKVTKKDIQDLIQAGLVEKVGD